MGTAMLVIAVLAAALVLAAGVWVAIVLVATIARAPRLDPPEDGKSAP